MIAFLNNSCRARARFSLIEDLDYVDDVFAESWSGELDHGDLEG